jgi:hypothetical protein
MFMCVGTMDGCSGIGYSSSEDMATWPFASEDELDSVGEATMPSIPHCPIVECASLSRALWVNLDALLLNDSGVVVAEGICRNTHP